MADGREIWGKITNGDGDAFGAWYRETAPHFKAFLRQLLADERAVEDVMQETFVQVWSRPDRRLLAEGASSRK